MGSTQTLPLPGTGPLRAEVSSGAELLGLCLIAVAQPVLDVLGKSPETFAFRGASAGDTVAIALAIAVVPALLLLLPGALARRWKAGLGDRLHLAAVFAVLVGVVLQVFGRVGVTDRLLRPIGVVFLASVGLVLFRRFPALRMWTRMLSFATPVVVALFLFASPTGDLVFGSPPELVTLEPPRPDNPATAPDEPAGGFPDVVMIVLDSLPTNVLLDDSGGIDPRRYPVLAGFADEATWYRRYTTVSSETTSAVPSLVSGILPSEAQNATWVSHPDTLFRLLGGSYHLAVSESPTQLCPRDWCGGGPTPPPSASIPAASPEDAPTGPEVAAPAPKVFEVETGGFAALLDDAIGVWQGQVDPEGHGASSVTGFEETVVETAPESTLPPSTTSRPGLDTRDLPAPDEQDLAAPPVFLGDGAQLPRVDEFRAAIAASDEPSLSYLHLVLPHAPYTFTETGRVYAGPTETRTTESEWGARVLAERLSLQMQYTDQLIGGIFDDLRAEGIYDGALLVVVADHPAGLDDTKLFRYYDGTNAAAVMVTPLLIKAPGQHVGIVSDAPAETVDVLPTLADMLDVEVPWEMDGTSLLDLDPSYVDPGCDDVRHFVRFGDDILDDDADIDRFELCANDIVPAGLVPILGPLRADDQWSTAALARFTPYPELLGVDWADLDVSQGPGRATLERRSDTVDGSSPGVGVIEGTVTDTGGAEWVAVVVDGTVAGISAIYDRGVFPSAERLVAQFPYLDDTQANRFSVIVPSSLQHERGYDVRLATLETVAGELRIEELSIEP